MSTMYIN